METLKTIFVILWLIFYAFTIVHAAAWIPKNLQHGLNNVDEKKIFIIIMHTDSYRKGQIIITGEEHNLKILESMDTGWKRTFARWFNFPPFKFYRYKVINIPRNRILQPCSLYYHIDDLNNLKVNYLTNPNLTTMEHIKVGKAFCDLVNFLEPSLERYGWIDFDTEMNVIHFEEHIDSNSYEFDI